METPYKKLCIKILLITFLLISLVRFLSYMNYFSQKSLQIDFSAYYTAGQSLNNGLSIYENNIIHDPLIWDGVAFCKYSRFLYAPLVGTFFRPLAHLPYRVAKYIWMFFNLLLILLAMIIAADIIKIEKSVQNYLAIGIFLLLFHPLLIYFERGQIDVVTLVLIIFAFKLMFGGNKQRFIAGTLIAVATLIKLNCLYLVPFLLIKRKWFVIYGIGAGLITLLLLSSLFNGPGNTMDYFMKELPRIAKYGEELPKSMWLPTTVVKRQSTTPRNQASKDGVTYQLTAFQFVANASLTRELSSLTNKHNQNLSRSIISLVLISVFIILILVHYRKAKERSMQNSPSQEFLFWQSILIIVLLTSPLTWVMNTVWLLPIIVILIKMFPLLHSKKQAIYFCLCAVGLIIAALPEHLSFSLTIPYGISFINYKYLISQIILVIALIGMHSSMILNSTGQNSRKPL